MRTAGRSVSLLLCLPAQAVPFTLSAFPVFFGEGKSKCC
jgi:hypothetical protein